MAKRKRASSIDVARLAGVSQSAVSRAFTPGAVISKETLAKVQEAADQLGYKPNVLARALITNRSNIIALVVGDLSYPFYARLTNDLSLRLQAEGFHVLLFSVSNSNNVSDAINELLKYRVDGVLLVSAALSSEMAAGCERAGTPVVLFNRYPRQPTVSAVRIENRDGARRLTEFLITGGHRRIAFVSGHSLDETGADRERGFDEALEEAGLQAAVRIQGDYSFESGYEAMLRIGRDGVEVDAVFCCADMTAFGAMDAARKELGLRVPEDVSVVGFDDLLASAWPSYDLTTIRQPVGAMAEAAIETLLHRISNPQASARTILFPGELVVRGSARTPPR